MVKALLVKGGGPLHSTVEWVTLDPKRSTFEQAYPLVAPSNMIQLLSVDDGFDCEVLVDEEATYRVDPAALNAPITLMARAWADHHGRVLIGQVHGDALLVGGNSDQPVDVGVHVYASLVLLGASPIEREVPDGQENHDPSV